MVLLLHVVVNTVWRQAQVSWDAHSGPDLLQLIRKKAAVPLVIDTGQTHVWSLISWSLQQICKYESDLQIKFYTQNSPSIN